MWGGGRARTYLFKKKAFFIERTNAKVLKLQFFKSFHHACKLKKLKSSFEGTR